MQKKNLLLSVLLPAYNYYSGVDRILEVFTKVNPKHLRSIEFIISDDSDLDHESLKISEISIFYKNRHGFNITCVHGSRTGNPADNWNRLIKLSSGVYKQIIHHDEFFMSENHIENLLQFINMREPEIFILNLYIADKTFLHKHLPSFIVNFFLTRAPSFILLKNFIGPTACIVFKSTHEFFNPNLRWIVDVEWYYRLLTKNKIIIYLSSVPIASEFNYQNSITSKIKESKIILKFKELKVIKFDFKACHYFFLLLWPMVKIYNLLLNFFIKKAINDRC